MKKRQIGSRTLAVVKAFFPQVTTIKDATRPALVEVTNEDNTHADVKSHRTCALALACKRYFDADGVIIGLTTSYIVFGKTAHRYKNAGTVSREITSFDRKAGFDVGFYHLSPPCTSSRLGADRHKATKSGKNTGTSLSRFRHFTTGVRTTLGRKGVPA